MLTDDEMLNLPDDPELAFVEFERITRQKYDNKVASAQETDMESDVGSRRLHECRAGGGASL